MQIVAVADDLSGATETLAALSLWGAKVWLNTENPTVLLDELETAKSFVIDANTRLMSEVDAGHKAKQIAGILANSARDLVIFHKVDSLLRGNVAAEVEESKVHGPVVIAVANPETDRTTVNGVVLVRGLEMHLTDLWSSEASQPWASIAKSLGGASSIVVSLDSVRRGPFELAKVLTEHARSGSVIICDSETDADLDAIAAATQQIRNVQLFGSAGLARALARVLRPSVASTETPRNVSNEVTVIVGSNASASKSQVAHLDELGIRWLTFRPEHGQEASFDEAIGSSLVLTGGATARAILENLGVDWLRPFHEIETGMVASSTSTFQTVVIKPGSYGDDQTLMRAVRYLINISQQK
jgi:4-hydroxythreonine-4-phosphate dehydrogenase